MPATSEANPRAISTRISHRDRVATNNQRHHNLRIGRQPGYVDGERTARNRILIADLTGGDLRQLCDQRREASGRVRQRRVSDTAAVAVAGIITFGRQAQPWIEALSVGRQDALFRDVAEAVAQRLGTTLHGLVIHLDESAIHAHYQLAAITHDGGPVSKVATKAVMNQLQDIAAVVAQRYEPRIERGRRKMDRLAAGAKRSEVVNRSVRQLHQDLPAELESLRQQIDAAQDKLAKNDRLAEEARWKAGKLAENAAKADAALKRAEIYERRAEAARVEREAARTALAEIEAKQAALASAPIQDAPTIEPPPRAFLPMSPNTPTTWAAEQNAVIAVQWEAAHAVITARIRDLDRREREAERRLQVAEVAERERGFRVLRRQEAAATAKARAAELEAGRRAIERLKELEAARAPRPVDLPEALRSLDFTEHPGRIWRGGDDMHVRLGQADAWEFRENSYTPITAGRGVLGLLALILGTFERALFHLCSVFGFARLQAEVEAAAAQTEVGCELQPSGRPSGPGI